MPGCGADPTRRGLCTPHYMKLYRMNKLEEYALPASIESPPREEWHTLSNLTQRGRYSHAMCSQCGWVSVKWLSNGDGKRKAVCRPNYNLARSKNRPLPAPRNRDKETGQWLASVS